MTNKPIRILSLISACALTLLSASAADRGMGEAPPNFKNYKTTHYLLKTDVSEDLAREAAVRIDAMFEEYAARTASFSHAPREIFPLILYSKRADYIADGGKKDSGGIFRKFRSGPGELRIVARADGGTWNVVQHEGFHQFAFTAIASDLPVWISEGLAEFFSEGLFTGDNFVTGLIPDGRRAKIVDMIEKKTYMPFDKFAALDDAAWGKKLTMDNYDQAWSMTHFLALADKGKYQPALTSYMRDVGKGIAPAKAWSQNFGEAAGGSGFEAAWKKFWSALPERPTKQLFAQARAMTITSFLARAALSGKKYTSIKEFLVDAIKGDIKLTKDAAIWLPPGLIQEWVNEETNPDEFKLTWNGNVPTLVNQYDDVIITVEYKNNKTVATVKESPKPK